MISKIYKLARPVTLSIQYEIFISFVFLSLSLLIFKAMPIDDQTYIYFVKELINHALDIIYTSHVFGRGRCQLIEATCLAEIFQHVLSNETSYDFMTT
jgi:hypothetical protein